MLRENSQEQTKTKFFIPAIYPPSLWENTIPIKIFFSIFYLEISSEPLTLNRQNWRDDI